MTPLYNIGERVIIHLIDRTLSGVIERIIRTPLGWFYNVSVDLPFGLSSMIQVQADNLSRDVKYN